MYVVHFEVLEEEEFGGEIRAYVEAFDGRKSVNAALAKIEAAKGIVLGVWKGKRVNVRNRLTV